ncbi:hypothetical protein [Polymorphobacter megasporae]|uniref:hypothetical protein n=1 Tax=Glacieibacterium megasporae TaxID=2835787 RepID=UPI001C1E22BC|nr:hypothetical protein [Polymorphobacter megasporae]UAJ10673.1 hypothetical protein KTC28_02665 [Polymorphobacter megasporae]
MRQAKDGQTELAEADVEQIEQFCRERLLPVALYRRQIKAWRRISLQAAEAAEADRLDATLDTEAAITADALSISKETCVTAERIVSKSEM